MPRNDTPAGYHRGHQRVILPVMVLSFRFIPDVCNRNFCILVTTSSATETVDVLT